MKILIKMGIAKIKIIETLHNSRMSQDIDGALHTDFTNF